MYIIGNAALMNSFGGWQVSTPDVREEDLTSEDEVMIMASDGLWDVISNQEAINIIKDTPVCLPTKKTLS